MAVKRFAIKAIGHYEKDGEQKAKYRPVGMLCQFDDGGLAFEWYATPDIKFGVYPDEYKQPQNQQPDQPQMKSDEGLPF